MVNEATSENIVLQGYISNTNLTNFDIDNTSAGRVGKAGSGSHPTFSRL